MNLPISLYVALRYWRAKSADRFGRLVANLASFGIVLGVMALIIVLSVMNGLEGYQKQQVLSSIPHAIVSQEAPISAEKPLENSSDTTSSAQNSDSGTTHSANSKQNEISNGGDEITILPASKIKPVEIITSEYPGFPTDMQAQFMALACISSGVSTIDERLFENRFMHVSELSRMGADIHLNGHIATISGGKLNGADVMATDLRASSALVLAALAARGESKIHRIYHLDRGYEKLEEKLSALGASIERLEE